MNSGIISTRYARALFSFAQAQNELDQVFSEMKTLTETLMNSNEVQELIDSPVINNDEKFAIVTNIFGGKISDVLQKFLHLVLDHRRERFLQTICLVFTDLYRDHKNIKVGKLITAAPINNTVSDRIKQLLQTKHSGEIEFETQVDPSIDGGFVLYIDTYRLDASIATQLKNIKRQLLSKNSRIA